MQYNINQSSKSYSMFWVILALATGSFCIGTSEFVAMGLIQEIANDLNISLPSAGHFITAYALGVMIGAPIIAILGARIPRKMLLVMLMVFYCLANASTAFATTTDAILASRFIAGLPHGAYFGVGSLVVAHLAGPEHRASAVAKMMLGLSVATVIGVPVATWLGIQFGWRSGFVFAAAIGLLTFILIMIFVPSTPVDENSSIKSELSGLKNINMWVTLAIGAIGFGGMFAVYSYIAPILTNYTHASSESIPIALAVWGIGMVLGVLVAGWLADKNLNKTMIAILSSSALSFVLAAFLMSNIYSAMIALFFIGFTIVGLGGALQMRLIDIAGNAQSLAASLNHSAFNLANGLGAFLGGLVLSQQMGWLAPIWVGFVLSLGGLAILFIAFALDKHQKNKKMAQQV